MTGHPSIRELQCSTPARLHDLGFNLGGGVLYSLSSRVGLRSDLRFFRALVDEDDREGGFFRDYGF